MQQSLAQIKKMHVSEAIQLLMKSQKKVAKLILPTFFNLIDHAKKRGLEPYRLFVHGLILGKQQRYKGLRYKAKMRNSVEKTDFCHVKIILHEMPAKEFFMQMAQGKTSMGFAYELKRTLVDMNAPFETVKKFRHLLTSRGRQQLRELTKRRVYNKQQENEQSSVFVPKKVVLQEIHEELAKQFEATMLEFTTASSQSNIKLRQELFRKNSAGL